MDGVLGFVLKCYQFLLRCLSPFVSRAKHLVKGQDESFGKLKVWRTQHPNDEVLWMHAASLGEFEQGRPVIEGFKRQYPNARVVLTFYSPSGYEVRKNYAGADLILYLPLDTKLEMQRWIQCLQPKLLALVKYEVWPNMLKALKTQNVPVVIFSAVFRDSHRFFSGAFRRYWVSVLKRVDYFHVQDEVSAQLLKSIGVQHISISGDTRYDRVWEVAQNAKVIDRYISWKGQSLVVVLGSSYTTEEEAIAELVEMDNGAKWVIAPHHIDEANVARTEKIYAGKTQRATDSGELRDLPVLILNTMGDLGGLYKLGEVAIVGGGWGKGIHNVLEPAAHGCAVLWGPRAEKFLEAKLLLERGGGVQVKSQGELVEQLREWIGNTEKLNQFRQSAKEMVVSQIGAEVKVLKTIGEFWESEKR